MLERSEFRSQPSYLLMILYRVFLLNLAVLLLLPSKGGYLFLIKKYQSFEINRISPSTLVATCAPASAKASVLVCADSDLLPSIAPA